MYRRDEIVSFLDEYLNINDIKDKSHNGLQVEGAESVSRIGLATDAALETYGLATKAGCQMLLVHHGLIWGGLNMITGRNYLHLKTLIDNSLNLYAAHLPLDAHPEVGNNVLLANMLELKDIQPFGNYLGCTIGFKAVLQKPHLVEELEAIFGNELNCTPETLRFGPSTINSLAIISGGGASMLDDAVADGVDCLVTGEASHDRYHQALEGKINLMLLGHYKSETIGVKALGKKLEGQFPNLETVFLDSPTGF